MKTIFYRCVPHNPDALVFAEAQDARRVDRIWHALNTAKTWGQFKRLLPASEHEQFEDCDAADDEAFDALDFTAEGDYPDWLQAQMERSSQPTYSSVWRVHAIDRLLLVVAPMREEIVRGMCAAPVTSS